MGDEISFKVNYKLTKTNAHDHENEKTNWPTP